MNTEAITAYKDDRKFTIFYIDDGLSILDNTVLKDLQYAYKHFDFPTYLQYKELLLDAD